MLDEDSRRESTARLNNAIIKRASYSDDLRYLASPITGSSIPTDRLSRLFLLSQKENKEDSVTFVWSILKSQRAALGKDGKVLDTDAENISALAEKYELFLQKSLPALKPLGIA